VAPLSDGGGGGAFPPVFSTNERTSREAAFLPYDRQNCRPRLHRERRPVYRLFWVLADTDFAFPPHNREGGLSLSNTPFQAAGEQTKQFPPRLKVYELATHFLLLEV